MIEEKSTSVSLLVQAHELVAGVLQDGDTAVDATLGNGHDALFLARCVGASGMVFGFDVQQAALINSRERLEADKVDGGCYQLICESHAGMEHYVVGQAKAVMFNLGYLPGGDKTRITHADSTSAALLAAAGLIACGGILTVMCYPGHDGGDDEARMVTEFINELDSEQWVVARYNRVEAKRWSPYLWAVTRSSANSDPADDPTEL